MNRLLKFLYRFQNQRRIHTWASFWTVVKMAWAQSGRKKIDQQKSYYWAPILSIIKQDWVRSSRTSGCDSSIVCHEVIDIEVDNDDLVDDNYTIIDLNMVK